MEGAADVATDGFADSATDGSTEFMREGAVDFVMDGTGDLATLESADKPPIQQETGIFLNDRWFH